MSHKHETYIDLEIVTLEKKLFSGKVKQISAPTKLGDITVLPGHEPLVTTLEAGEIKLKVDEGEGIYSPDMIYIAVSSGFMEIEPGRKVDIIADSALRVDEIDEKKALEAKEKAEKMLKEYREGKEKMTDQEFAGAAAQLAKALAELKVVRRRKRK